MPSAQLLARSSPFTAPRLQARSYRPRPRPRRDRMNTENTNKLVVLVFTAGADLYSNDNADARSY